MTEQFEHGVPFTHTVDSFKREGRFNPVLFKRRIKPWALSLQGNRILDAAAGTGGHANELSKLGLNVVSQDISRPMLTASAHKLLVQASADILPYKDGAFDGVSIIDAMVFFNPEMRQRMFRELHRVLDEKGRVLVISEVQHEGYIYTLDKKTGSTKRHYMDDSSNWKNAVDTFQNTSKQPLSAHFPVTTPLLQEQAFPCFDLIKSAHIKTYHNKQSERSSWHPFDMVMGIFEKRCAK